MQFPNCRGTGDRAFIFYLNLILYHILDIMSNFGVLCGRFAKLKNFIAKKIYL